VAIDTDTGKIVASAKIAQKVDQIAFDPGPQRIYAAAAGVLNAGRGNLPRQGISLIMSRLTPSRRAAA